MRIQLTEKRLYKFLGKIRPSENGCLEWIGTRNKYGYGELELKKRRHRAHRIAYMQFCGDIPENLVIDHVCRNRACVNVAHLRTITHRENILAGISPTAVNYQKTYCKRGHKLGGTNSTKRSRNEGTRECRLCKIICVQMKRKEKKSLPST